MQHVNDLSEERFRHIALHYSERIRDPLEIGFRIPLIEFTN